MKKLEHVETEPNPPLLDPPRLLDVRGAASYLGTTPWFIRTLVWGHKIPHIRLGKRTLLDRADLDQFVEKAKVA